jgi:hypothetical protein
MTRADLWGLGISRDRRAQCKRTRLVTAAAVGGLLFGGLLFAAGSASAAAILFKWDKVLLDPGGSGKYLPVGDGPYKDTNGAGGIKRSDATGADLGNSRFGPPAVGFSSIGHAKGAFHKNISDNVIEDVHIKLLGADTVDPASIGGSAFPMVMISADMKEVWFAGGKAFLLPPAGVAEIQAGVDSIGEAMNCIHRHYLGGDMHWAPIHQDIGVSRLLHYLQKGL